MRKVMLVTLAAAFGLGAGVSALAQTSGKSGETPGHEMLEHGNLPGSPGASGYAPDHTMDADHGRARDATGSSLRDRNDLTTKRERD